jgi:hypothetical protein
MNNPFGQYPQYVAIVNIPEFGINEGDIIVIYKDKIYNTTTCKEIPGLSNFDTKYFIKISDWASKWQYGIHLAITYKGEHQFDAILCDDNPEEMLLAPDDHIHYPDYVTLSKICEYFHDYSFKEISYYYYVDSDGTTQLALVGENESQDLKRKEIKNYFYDKTTAINVANKFISMLKSFE